MQKVNSKYVFAPSLGELGEIIAKTITAIKKESIIIIKISRKEYKSIEVDDIWEAIIIYYAS